MVSSAKMGSSEQDRALVSGWLHQLCDGMIFNHDPPRCVDCLDCGGASHCGMECSALMAKNIGGYDVCTTIGKVTSTTTNIIDNQNPHKGVIVKMTSSGSEHNCSLSVSVICDSNRVLGPHSLEKLGTCDYAAVLQHPSGCATINGHGKGWGWFGTLDDHCLMSFWRLFIGGCSLSTFLPWISWVRYDSKLGFLDQATSQNTEFFCIFGTEI
uniref:Uncharacterized protein n=1 Tax=Salix viminalis TaxID=40686 RepID=A0A6N2LRD0_SALVM